MSLDSQAAGSMLRTAELTNAPNTGFSELAIGRLGAIESALESAFAESGTTVTVGFVLELLGVMLGETAACELLVLHTMLEAKTGGSVQAEITVRINEALAATTCAYGALSDVYEIIRQEDQ